MDTKRSHCKFLRTKTAYVPETGDLDKWRDGESSTAQYWCLCTMGTAGPDNDLVAPDLCQQSRTCFQATLVTL